MSDDLDDLSLSGSMRRAMALTSDCNGPGYPDVFTCEGTMRATHEKVLACIKKAETDGVIKINEPDHFFTGLRDKYVTSDEQFKSAVQTSLLIPGLNEAVGNIRLRGLKHIARNFIEEQISSGKVTLKEENKNAFFAELASASTQYLSALDRG